MASPKTSSKDKISIFHVVSNKKWTGAEQYTYDLVSELRHDQRYYVEVVCRKNDAVLKPNRTLEVPVSILPLKGITDIDSPVRFARLLRKGRNVVHVHSFKDAFMAVMARRISENPATRIVISVHGVYIPKKNYIYRKLYKSIDCFVFASQMSMNAFLMENAELAGRCKVVRESIAPIPEGGSIEPLRKQLQMSAGQVLLMYHGRLAPEKGLDVLLQAVAQLDKQSYKLVIIGEGKSKYVTQLKGFILANQLAQNVKFLGFRERILDYVRQCDIGVLPSTQREVLGMANLEYMKEGRPHISTNNGAQLEYVRDGENGILVDPGNQYALAVAIKSLIDDPARRAALGRQAQRDFDALLNYDIFYRGISDLYQGLFVR